MSRPGPGGARELPDVADTEAFGAELASTLTAGDVVILDGPLGAGKTALARGIGAGLGVVGRVTSPTFIIAREHRPGRPDRPGMVHVDAYRLGGTGNGSGVLDELDALDLDSDLDEAVVVVEWGEGVAERLADRHLVVRLRRDADSDVRHVEWEWVSAE
ncbi:MULTISPECIES: tRNA (adenosine(37)-N6)-threonylcarbamoyltransferase complex ATPase subunit type 1 TsaE [Gordonia]|jgi:tRNA threonylcarbamoyladenosine biosynthesis protein TsaE|uniref:tRNA threonylcarbamoyladenosine biosynthesis protein TsaE n=2 Tax=Gordonia terrae TaxID=2055 RepID=A0A2I1RCM9_9ACTN|nr:MULTISPECIES: tRNA (adenosine(37)-N6)-threonylcarbamoyltransferase complex ATPase subunit type 1 TsaE [Gordonia]VTR07385.1 ATPase, YjeE family [Clostridioides difficile]ANY25946.1 tRNA (N6-adenosine(37)-N6)-threonylcarbamoyltransferase complex ATPase TsaE [Gordonia terrae]AWO86688.1 tRNA (adenosine(37)-N6)-threonylcarbamoyltransferase complex ATPase subunit type 1 TsaE [Gordonia terrae]MCG7632071.1 tRNA (adenosine(37)-N6)-threonylcarbamoyltransferase complex ATPase subunit type 1 TsaE [Gordo